MVADAPAQRLPLPPVEQTAVNHAIDRGVAYLKRTQQKSGTWANPNQLFATPRDQIWQKTYPFGYTALPGLTLLECGVPPDDAVVQKAAQILRTKGTKLESTYELSLAILFLDRLGDPEDEKLIQTFALRLVAGQSATGGWGYKCPILNSKVQTELLMALRHLDPAPDDMPAIAQRPGKNPGQMPLAKAPGAPPVEGAIARPAAPSLSDRVRRSPGESSSLSDSISRGSPGESPAPQDKIAGPPDRAADSKGLKILDTKGPELPESGPAALADPKKAPNKPDGKAGKDKPADAKAAEDKSSKPFVIPERIKRLPVIQDPDKLVWQDPLNQAHMPIVTTTDNSNTQFAILALWTAQRHDLPLRRSLNLIVRRYQTSQNADGSWGYHYLFGGGENTRPLAMTCVGLIGLAVGHGLAQPRPVGQPVQDPRIINGLIALSKNVGQPVEQPGWLPMQNLYYLWSLERVAVLYNLPTIGDKDWYRWGAQVLLRNQEKEGNWANGNYIGSSPPLDTCLALLFLKRANLVKDLTAKLPFTGDELNKGIRDKLEPPKPTESKKETKKAIPPIVPSKPEEPEKTITVAKTPPAVEAPEPVNEGSGSKKKWVIVSVIVFLLFAGGSLFFLFSARRRDETTDEATDDKPKKQTNKRKQRSTK